MSDDYSNTTGASGQLSVGGSTTGTIETVNDQDWFRVSLTAGQTYTFRLNAAVTNGLYDPYLKLYNGSGTYLTYNDDGGGNLNSLLTYTPTASGTYYLEARAYSSGTGAYTLSVNSATAADTTAPVVTSFSPADETTGVNVGSNVVVTFSEAIARGSGTIYLKTATGTVVESFDAATSGRISLSGTTLTLDPSANLANGTGYRVEFGAGTVRDLAGNSYAGTTSYNFTTVTAVTDGSPNSPNSSMVKASALNCSMVVRAGTPTL